MSYVIKSVKRVKERDPMSGAINSRDELVVEIFRTEDGASATAIVTEADNTGLITEFTAGTATTILDTAVDTWLSSVGLEDDPLSSTQESWKDNYSIPV